MPEGKQLCSFYLGDSLYGIDVSFVREANRGVDVTPVPLAPPEILGIVNLRGEIITSVDLGLRLGSKSNAPLGERPAHLFVKLDDGTVGFAVNAIGDVFTLQDELFEPTPATLQGEARDLIMGAYKLSDGLLLAVDPVGAAEV